MDELIREISLRHTSEDLDDHVHELKSKEASAINNAGIEEQIRYLVREGGEDWVREVFLPDEGETCPHGEPLGDCNACDVAGDLAFDADREDRHFK